MRWWGIGRGYFRNAVAVVLFVLLVGTLVVLLLLQRTLRPLMITARKGELPPLAERVLVQHDSVPATLSLGEWMVFCAISDSCSRVVAELASEESSCNAVERIYRRVQRQLATELNRYGWGEAQFRAYQRAALAYHHDPIPSALRWIERCGIKPIHHQDYADTTGRHIVEPLLGGRTWWLQLGFANDHLLPSSGERQ